MKEIKYKPSSDERAQEMLATHLHKLFAGALKPDNEKILERLKVKSREIIQRV